MENEDLVKVLFDRMNEGQQLRFKQSIVAQTVYYVSQRLPPVERDEGERGFIELANRWLAQPTAENADKALMAAVFDRVDGGVRYFDYSDYFLLPAEVVGAENGYEATKDALKAAGEFVAEAKQWQRVVADRILADTEYI
ncbi:hypothetical protein [Chamaesiphon polymorphus]|nr:hypothetical protein [Chamaesiphon polymorphus]